MKKRIMIISGAVLLVLVIVAAFIIIFTTGKQEKLLLSLQNVSEINYNNYLSNNYIDYKDGQFACLKSTIFGARLTTLDSNGDYQYFDNIAAPFQIHQKQIVFISNNNLQFKDLDTQKTTKIANGIDSFIAYQNYIIYCSASTFNENSGKRENKLSIYDLSSKKTQSIYENLQQFYVHQNKLFVVNNDDWLVEISLSDFSPKKIIHLEVDQYPFFAMPQSDNLLYKKGNQLFFINIKTGDKNSITLVDDEYSNNRISFICDDKNVFWSFQATKADGSTVSNIASANNGLWTINPQTLQKEKICDTVFEQLYLFGDELLFAVKNNDIYQIDIATKKASKINNQ